MEGTVYSLTEMLVTGGIGILTTIVSGFTAWFFARKKYNSEVDNQVITNMKESLEFYKQLSDDNKERLTQVLEQNREILAQNAKLLEQNKQLELEVQTLKSQIKLLTTKIASVEISKSRKKTSKGETNG